MNRNIKFENQNIAGYKETIAIIEKDLVNLNAQFKAR